MDSDRLEVFVAVAREHGFSAAARALGRSQPAVSQAVAALEGELGQRLFVREGRSVVLTHAGRLLLEHADRALDELRRARERIVALSELRAGTLAIGTTDTLACYLLAPVLQEVRRRWPRLELSIDTRPSPVIAQKVAARTLDVGVIMAPTGVEHLTETPLRPLHDVAIVPESHALARRKRVRLEELAEHPLVLLDRTTGTRAYLEAELRRRDLAPRIAIETTSVEVVKRFVSLGLGVSIVPAMAVADRDRVASISVEGLRAGRRVVAVTAAGEPTTPAAAAFVEAAHRVVGRS
jgi:DNA-binding transcriptional LysR family regulator